jgi:hypothetical protein
VTQWHSDEIALSASRTRHVSYPDGELRRLTASAVRITSSCAFDFFADVEDGPKSVRERRRGRREGSILAGGSCRRCELNPGGERGREREPSRQRSEKRDMTSRMHQSDVLPLVMLKIISGHRE